MRFLHAGNHFACASDSSLSSRFDAGRLGRPSVDYLLHLVYLPSRSCSVPFGVLEITVGLVDDTDDLLGEDLGLEPDTHRDRLR